MALPDTHTGRDAVRHIVFDTVAKGAAYVGRIGQPWYVIDKTALVVQHRVGDGRKGGQLIASNIISSLPANIAKVANTTGVTIETEANEGTEIIHGLGYIPLVQVLDNSTTPPSVVEIEFAHTDNNTVVLYAEPAIADATVLLR